MKNFLPTLLFLILAALGMAQEKEPGGFQVGAFGGASFPLGTYKSIGETKTGYFGGIFVDRYFNGNKFGLGIDARHLAHGIGQDDSVHFANGSIGTDYANAKTFRHWAFTLGPTYKVRAGKFHAEAFVRGGVLMQEFPQYERTMTYTPIRGAEVSIPVRRTANDPSNKANAWVGLGGLRFNYSITANLAAFVQADYMQTFGTKFGSKNSEFYVEERDPPTNGPGGAPLDPPPLDEKTELVEERSWMGYYGEEFSQRKTPYKSANVGAGLKYTFGRKKPAKKPPVEEKIAEVPVAPVVVDPVPEKKEIAKAIQIVVKDRQTGLALSGVAVSVESPVYNTKDISNANGEIGRIASAQAATYRIVGDKNGIRTDTLLLTEADFAGNDAVIYREILHDDPRFTLIGETVDCQTNTGLAHIATVLTHSGDKSNMSQTSDAEGKFIYQLNQSADYSIVANQSGRYSQTELLSTKGLDRSKTLYVTLKLGVCDLVEGGNWVLKNIHYDFDKSNIRPDAAVILDNVIAVLKQNPTLRIELSSHTDSRGNDSYNMRLSQRRADAAVEYLVKNGIERSRLVAKGYGESRLLNGCGNGVNCSEEQHQENRRTEIKVLDFK